MKEMIVHNNPKSPISEAYRGIRTNLQFANVDHNVKTIIVSSATSGEGKTTTLCNLAMTLADSDKKVMIVDCDLRKPRVHKFLEISNAQGVTDVLLRGEHYSTFVHKGIHPHLDVLTSGRIPTNPSELLNSEAMKAFMKQLSEDYDYVLIDSPPIIPVTDTVIMSTYIDRVILVCASGQIEVEMAKKATEKLEHVGAKILGVVLNKVKMNSKKYHYYYYYMSDTETNAKGSK